MNKNYLKYCIYLILSLIVTSIGAFVGDGVKVSNIGAFVISIALMLMFFYSKGTAKKIIFAVFCFGEGFSLSNLLSYYTEAKLIECLIITVIVTIICMAIGLFVKNLSKLGSILFALLIAFVVYNLISLIIPLPSIALLGALLFSAYISYDINRFKQLASTELSTDNILNEVMDMYLNLLNLFLLILDITND